MVNILFLIDKIISMNVTDLNFLDKKSKIYCILIINDILKFDFMSIVILFYHTFHIF